MVLRLGMIGMWHVHAEGLVRRAAEHPDEFQFLCFHDPDPSVAAERHGRWREWFPGSSLVDRPSEVFRAPIDAVVVEGQVDANVAHARAALEAGFPVLLEKPAGTNLTDFEALIALADARGLRVQMLYLFRYMSAVREMLRLARNGELGEVYHFRGRLPKELSLYETYVEELGRYPGGIFFEMAGHLVDMMTAMLGPPRAVHSFLAHHHDSPARFIDHGVAVFEYPRAFGVVEVPALEVVPGMRRIEVYGTKGAAVLPHLGSGHLANAVVQPLDVCLAGQTQWRTLPLPAAELQITDLREFASVLAGKKSPDYSSAHDLAVHDALLRASGMLETTSHREESARED